MPIPKVKMNWKLIGLLFKTFKSNSRKRELNLLIALPELKKEADFQSFQIGSN